MINKKVTYEQWESFWKLFEEKHLDISYQIARKSLIDGMIVTDMHNPMMLTTNPVMLTTSLYCSPSGQFLQ